MPVGHRFNETETETSGPSQQIEVSLRDLKGSRMGQYFVAPIFSVTRTAMKPVSNNIVVGYGMQALFSKDREKG